MFAKSFVQVMALCSIVVLAGCGTIGARATNMNPPPFAGLRLDFTTLGDVFSNKQDIEPIWYWLGLPLVSAIIVADIPVSAVFDLYCLPVDLARHKEPSEELDISIDSEASK